jgi:hypothetical protein
MSKEASDLKYPMVDLLTDTTVSLMYLNMLTASHLMLLSTPWAFMQAWMKGFEGGSEAAPKQRELLSDNLQPAVSSVTNRRTQTRPRLELLGRARRRA